jgi:HPt (histidine-containing phosphotransfer) domain-containing protein
VNFLSVPNGVKSSLEQAALGRQVQEDHEFQTSLGQDVIFGFSPQSSKSIEATPSMWAALKKTASECDH